MKRIVMFLCGFLPLPLGYFLRHLLMNVWLYSIPAGILFLMGCAVLVLWFMLGFIFVRNYASKLEAVLCLNTAAALALVFIILLISTLFIGRATIVAELFYLPLLRLQFILLSAFTTLDITVAYFSAFGCLVIVSWLGAEMGERTR
ncbi:MAG: hypothetical protein FWD96_04225 [Defluviitaleaceae bacterium]|nr:hypothetical protein [Defluviitaleaceae bacterium]